MTNKTQDAAAVGANAQGGNTQPISPYGACYLLRELGTLYGRFRAIEEAARELASQAELAADDVYSLTNGVLSDIQGAMTGPSEPTHWPDGEEAQILHEHRPRKGRGTSYDAAHQDLSEEAMASRRDGQRAAAAYRAKGGAA